MRPQQLPQPLRGKRGLSHADRYNCILQQSSDLGEQVQWGKEQSDKER